MRAGKKLDNKAMFIGLEIIKNRSDDVLKMYIYICVQYKKGDGERHVLHVYKHVMQVTYNKSKASFSFNLYH